LGCVCASCFELSCAWAGVRDDGAESNRIESTMKCACLKERSEYSVLALYSDSDGIDLSKTRIDFANEVWGSRERMFGRKD
jgi:hypothetical protein